jgi:hypothetical protein
MKTLYLFLALVVFSLATTLNLHADNISATLNTGLNTDNLIETSILNGEQFTYTHLTTDVLNTSLTVFTATYVDALGTLGVLNVTDVCTDVTILGPAVPCQKLAFSFTDLTLGNTSLIAALGADVNLAANVANIDFASASIAGGSASVNFTNPGGTSPVPEPATLSLMATGLVGLAGAMHRKFATQS